MNDTGAFLWAKQIATCAGAIMFQPSQDTNEAIFCDPLTKLMVAPAMSPTPARFIFDCFENSPPQVHRSPVSAAPLPHLFSRASYSCDSHWTRLSGTRRPVDPSATRCVLRALPWLTGRVAVSSIRSRQSPPVPPETTSDLK